jgi:glutamate-1-semialdehyde 2,1-aminomutase
MTAIDRARLRQLHARETQRFVSEHPLSEALYQRPIFAAWWRAHELDEEMGRPFPLFVKSALGAHFTDVDDYIDLCLGDTGAMTGHRRS